MMRRGCEPLSAPNTSALTLTHSHPYKTHTIQDTLAPAAVCTASTPSCEDQLANYLHKHSDTLPHSDCGHACQCTISCGGGVLPFVVITYALYHVAGSRSKSWWIVVRTTSQHFPHHLSPEESLPSPKRITGQMLFKCVVLYSRIEAPSRALP